MTKTEPPLFTYHAAVFTKLPSSLWLCLVEQKFSSHCEQDEVMLSLITSATLNPNVNKDYLKVFLKVL
jgi:hypothetical protein